MTIPISGGDGPTPVDPIPSEVRDIAAALGGAEVVVYPSPPRPPVKHWLMRDQILGHLAMWAVRQSPYDVPDDMEGVLRRLGEKLRPLFDAQDMAQLTWSDIEAVLERHLFADPQFMAWNERKNGRQGAGFASRYGTSASSPDDDFIDLNALIRNTSVSLFRELDRDAAFDSAFERRQVE
jgi:hypothetical protein